MRKERVLSVLIDESGDFGKLDRNDPFYHVVMVSALENKLRNWGYENHYIHVAPLIRRESPYVHELREDRKALFNALFHFARTAPISYIGVSMDKRKIKDDSVIGNTDAITKEQLRLYLRV